MRRLYVLYDGACGVCCRAVARLAWEPTYVELRFAPAGSMAAQQKFGSVLGPEVRQVVVVADTGEVYRGSSAWIMVLWALRKWRPLAVRLAQPGWRPWVDRAVDFIGRHRYAMSALMGGGPEHAVLSTVRADVHAGGACETCASGACPTGHATGGPPNPLSAPLEWKTWLRRKELGEDAAAGEPG